MKRKTAAAKGGGKSKRKAKPKTGPDNARAVRAEQMSYRDRQRRLHNFADRVKEKQPAFDAAKKVIDDIFNEAKEEGVSRDDLKALIAYTSGDKKKKETQLNKLKRSNEVCKMANLQSELFPDQPLSHEEKVYEDGRIAAYAREARKPPTYLNDEDQQLWMAGHAAGTEQINKAAQQELESGFKKLGDVVVGGAAAVDSLANGEQEHREAA